MGALENYLSEHNGKITSELALYLAELDLVSRVSKRTAGYIVNELKDQRTHLKLIASENFSSLSVQAAIFLQISTVKVSLSIDSRQAVRTLMRLKLKQQLQHVACLALSMHMYSLIAAQTQIYALTGQS